VYSLFASLLKKYTRVTQKMHDSSSSSSLSASAANHHDNSSCVVECVDETDLVSYWSLQCNVDNSAIIIIVIIIIIIMSVITHTNSGWHADHC